LYDYTGGKRFGDNGMEGVEILGWAAWDLALGWDGLEAYSVQNG
jgi:hypothetical protein